MATAISSRDQSLQDLLVFHNVARALTSSLDLDSILRVIMKQMEQFFQPQTWSLLMVDEKRKDLYFAVAAGQTAEALHHIRVPIGEGIAGWVAQHGETLIVPELKLDPRFSSTDRSSLPGNGTRSSKGGAVIPHSAICIPLRSRLKTLGVIQLFNCPVETLTDYTISFLHVLCDYAAIAIENARAVQRIQELTITDDCTTLFNVRYFYERLEDEIEDSRRSKRPLSLIFIDLDYFKQINDEHGHLTGSRLLSEVGQRLQGGVRAVDSAFRYGGDEFVVLLPATGKEQAMEVARRLQEIVRGRPFPLEGKLLEVRASFGVATFPDCGNTVHEIISQADKAMYRIKNSTRNGISAADVLPLAH
ncbi:MAG TPA: sensor domain-containing diguanylate cyclase [Acidisarcina sp.]